MTLADELKILDDKIKTNQAQYDFDREAAKISELLSKELDKYEYLTSEELGYKQECLKKLNLSIFHLSETFIKELKKKVIRSVRINTTMIWCMNLCITLINIRCFVLMKYHQLTLNLIH